MKTKIIFTFLAIFLISIYVYRVKSISNVDFYPKEKRYDSNEEVFFENDFFDSLANNMAGYSITFWDNELMNKEEFLSKYNLNDDTLFPKTEYIFLVKANIKNYNNDVDENHGINAAQFMLQDNAFMVYASRNLFPLINEDIDYSFALMPNSNKDILIPFCIDNKSISINRLKKRKPNVVITLYPNKKTVSLNTTL